MFTITKEFAFSASHQLSRLPESHQCARLHGHNYVVRVELSAPALDANNFVRDYGELAELKRYIDDTLGWDFYAEDNDPNGTGGHGTHVAGVVGATRSSKFHLGPM